MKKKIDYYYILLGAITLVLIGIIVGTDFLFGSKTDWINQHTVFPDYFRTLFYQTGDLIPNFAPQIGAGQNIFNFSYYGLLNPLILFSYFLPMISMTDYIIAINIILILSTVFLLYYFLKKHIQDRFCCFISVLLVLFSSSFLFQFHRHFMFVSYMPFLILGLIGIDAYFKKGTKWIYAIATFLMIMTSYYYSIIGIFLFVLYGIYHYLKQTNKPSIQSFFKVGIPFLIPIIVGILMAGVLLLPTAYVILTSRGGEHLSVSVFDLLLPKANVGALVYDTYALGLTAISFIACIYLLQKKEMESKFIVISTLLVVIFPIFIYLLNGTLYIRNKVFIPFLPFFAFIIATFLEDLFHKKMNVLPLIFLMLGIGILCFITGYHNLLFYLDFIVMILFICLYYKWNHKWLLILPLFIVVTINLGCAVYQMNLVPKEFYHKVFSKEKDKLINQTLDNESQIVRFSNLDNTLYNINKIYHPNYYQTSLYASTYHNGYDEFFKHTMNNALPYRNKLILAQTDNIMFQTLMGVKYVISSHTPSIGYNEIKQSKQDDTLKVYENKNVLPLGYASSNLLNETYFKKLKYPNSNEAILTNIIVKNKGEKEYKSQLNKFTKKANILKEDNNLSIKKTEKGYEIDAKKKATITITFDHIFDEEILFLNFDMNNQHTCSKGDQQITINQIANKLTCKEWQYQNDNHTFHYVLSQNQKWEELTITFQKGHYEIENIQMYTLDYQNITDAVSKVDPFLFDKDKTKGDTIVGTIDVTNDGYLATTIPYDKGFQVKVDGKEIEYEKVNTTFLGFPITKGKHKIEITYHSPLLNIGCLISFIGFIGFGILCYQDWKKYKNQ